MIYFIQSSGLIKIGFTAKPKARIQALLNTNPGSKLLKLADGTVETERQFHGKFAHIRQRGEWFTVNKELIDFINSLPDYTFQGSMFDEIAQRFGMDVKRMRLNKNLKQEDFSELAGISLTALKNLETGSGVSFATVIKVAVYLNKRDWLYNFAPTVSINPLDMMRDGRSRRRARRTIISRT